MSSYDNTDLYDDIFNYMRPDFNFVWATLEILSPRTIAEHGAGTGRLLPLYLATDAKKITGLDLEQNMVDAFRKKGDTRVEAYCADLRIATDKLVDADLLVITSSLMKHIHPDEISSVWKALYDSIADDTIIFIDHSEFVYGKPVSTDWVSYYDTLKYWWAEEHRCYLKDYFWKKEVTKTTDSLFYRKASSEDMAVVNSYIYSTDKLEEQLTACGFKHQMISDSFAKTMQIEGNKRFIGLATKKTDIDLTDLCSQIRELALGRCTP
ncbi:MAG: methyltransferase domain-containing protein [Desulfuromonadaceae bacterium]